MNIVLTILQKVIVNHFYRVNAGFFLFMFFVLFGVPANIAQFHLAILTIIIQNPLGLAGGMLIWLLYNAKCIDYVVKHLRSPQQQFLFCINNLPPPAGLGYMVYVQALVYMPVMAYSLAAAAMAIKTQHYFSGAAILLFTAASVLLAAAIYLRVLQRKPVVATGMAMPQTGIRLGKPLFTLPLFYLLHSRRQMLLVAKFFSLLALYIFFKVYEPDHYDIRPLLLCFMLVTAANSAAVLQIKAFEDSYLGFARNFPISLFRRFGMLVCMYACLMLPELVFVCKGWPLHVHAIDYPQLLLLSVGLLTIFHGALNTDNMDNEDYFKIVFALMAVLFFVILYNPGILLECVLLVVSYGVFASYYHGFEKKYD